MGVTTVIKDYGTDILNAIRENDIQRFKTILEKHLKSERKISKLCISDIKHKPTKKFACPLILAARQDDPRILKYMMDRSVDPNFVHHTIYSSKRKEIVTALHIAVDLGLYDSVQILLEANADCNIGDHNQETPLHIAVKKADRILVRILLSKGADPLLLDRRGNSALHIGTLYGHLQLVQTLLKYDADVYQKGQSGAIPPHIAAKEGHIHLIQLFCLRDVGNINIKIPCYADRREKAPIHLAAENGHVETIRALISQFDADVNLKDSDKNTPLHCVVLNQYNPHRMRDKDDFTETARMLLKGRVSINEKNMYGDTALHLAAMNQFQRIVELLLAVGANPFLENDEHLKPIDVVPDFDPVTKQLLKNTMLGPRPPITASMDSLRKGYDLSPTPSDTQSLRKGHGIGYLNTSDPNLDDERMQRTMSFVSQSTMSIGSSVFDERGIRGLGPPPPPKNPPPTSQDHDLNHSHSSKSRSHESGEEESLYNELHNQDTMPIYTRPNKNKKTSGQQTVPPQMSTFSQQTRIRQHSTGQQTEKQKIMNMGTHPEIFDDQMSVISDTSYMQSGTMTSELKRMLSRNRKQMAMYEDDASETTSIMDTESEYMSGSAGFKKEKQRPIPHPRSRSSSKPSSTRQTPVIIEKPLPPHVEERRHSDEQVYANIEYDAEGKPQVRKTDKPNLPPPRAQPGTAISMQQQLQQQQFQHMQEQMQQQIETLQRLQLQQQELSSKPVTMAKPQIISLDQHPTGIQIDPEPKKKPGSIEVQYGSGGSITLSLDTHGSQYSVQQSADGITYLVSDDGQDRLALNDLIQQHNAAQTTQHIYLPSFRGDLSADLDDTEVESASMVSVNDVQQEAVRQAIQQKVVELTETRYGDPTNPDISQLLQEADIHRDTHPMTPPKPTHKPWKDTPARPSLQQKQQKQTPQYTKPEAGQGDEVEEEDVVSPDQSPNMSPKYKNFKQALAFAKSQQAQLSQQQQKEHERLLKEQRAQQEELQEYLRHQQEQLDQEEKQQRKVKKQSQQLKNILDKNQSIVTTPEVKNWTSKQSSDTAVVVETNQWEDSPVPQEVVQMRTKPKQQQTNTWEDPLTPRQIQMHRNANRHQLQQVTQHQREPRPMSQYMSSDFPSSSVEELLEEDQVNPESDSDEDDEETEDVHPSQLQQKQLHQQSHQQHIQQLVHKAQQHVPHAQQQRLAQITEQHPELSEESRNFHNSITPGVSSSEAGPGSARQMSPHPFVIQPTPINKVSESSSSVPSIGASLSTKGQFQIAHANGVLILESTEIMQHNKTEQTEQIEMGQVDSDELLQDYNIQSVSEHRRAQSVEVLSSSPLGGERLVMSPTRSVGAITPNSMCSAGSSGSGLNMRVTGEMPKAFSRATKATARIAFIKAPPQGIESSSECSDVEYLPTSPFERSSHSNFTGSPNPEVSTYHASLSNQASSETLSNSPPANRKEKRKPLGAPIPPPYQTFGTINPKIDALLEAMEQNSNSRLNEFDDEDINELNQLQEVFTEIPSMQGSPRLIRPKPSPSRPVVEACVTKHVEEIKAEIFAQKQEEDVQPLGVGQVADIPAMQVSPPPIKPKPAKKPRPAVKARGTKKRETGKGKEKPHISTTPLRQDYISEEHIEMVVERSLSKEQADESVAMSTFKKNIKVREDGPETYQAETLEQDIPSQLHKKTVIVKEQQWDGENVIETLTTTVLGGDVPESKKAVAEIINSSQGEESKSSSESDDDKSDDMKQYDYEPVIQKPRTYTEDQHTVLTAAMQIEPSNVQEIVESDEMSDEQPFAQQPVTVKKRPLTQDNPNTEAAMLPEDLATKKKLLITNTSLDLNLPQVQVLETATTDEVAEDESFKEQLKRQSLQLSQKQEWNKGTQELYPQNPHQIGSQAFLPSAHPKQAIQQATPLEGNIASSSENAHPERGQEKALQVKVLEPHETDIDADLDLKPSKLPNALPSHLLAPGLPQHNLSTDMADQEVAFLSAVGEEKKQAKQNNMGLTIVDVNLKAQLPLSQSNIIQQQFPQQEVVQQQPLKQSTLITEDSEEVKNQLHQSKPPPKSQAEAPVQKPKPARIQGRAAARKLQQQKQNQNPSLAHIPVSVFKQHAGGDDDSSDSSDSSDSESNSDSGNEQNISAPMTRNEAKKVYKKNKLKQIQENKGTVNVKPPIQMLPAAFAPSEKSTKGGFWSLSSMRKKKDKSVKGSQDNLSIKSGDEDTSEEKPKKKGLFSKRNAVKATSGAHPVVAIVEMPVTPEIQQLAISPERAPSSGGSEPDMPREGFEETVMGAATGSVLDRSDTIRELGKDKRKAGFFNLASMRSKKKDKKKKVDQFGAAPYIDGNEARQVQHNRQFTEQSLQQNQQGQHMVVNKQQQFEIQKQNEVFEVKEPENNPGTQGYPCGQKIHDQQPQCEQQLWHGGQAQLEQHTYQRFQSDGRTPSETNLDEVFAMKQQQQIPSKLMKSQSLHGSRETNLDDILAQQPHSVPSKQQPCQQSKSDFQNAALAMMMGTTGKPQQQPEQHPQVHQPISHRQQKMSDSELISQMWAQKHQGNLHAPSESRGQGFPSVQYDQHQLPPDVQYGQGGTHPRGKRYFKKHEKPLQPIKHITKSLEDVAFAHLKANLGNGNSGIERSGKQAVMQSHLHSHLGQEEQHQEQQQEHQQLEWQQHQHYKQTAMQQHQEQLLQQHTHNWHPGMTQAQPQNVFSVQQKPREKHIADAPYVAQMWKENQDHKAEMEQILQSVSDVAMVSAGEDALRYERQHSDDARSLQSVSGEITPIQWGSSSSAAIDRHQEKVEAFTLDSGLEDIVRDVHHAPDTESDPMDFAGPHSISYVRLNQHHQQQQDHDKEPHQQEEQLQNQQELQNQQLQQQQQLQYQEKEEQQKLEIQQYKHHQHEQVQQFQAQQQQYQEQQQEHGELEQYHSQTMQDNGNYYSEQDPLILNNKGTAIGKETQQERLKEQESDRYNAPSPKPSIPKKPSHLKWGTAGGKPKVAAKPTIANPKVQLISQVKEKLKSTAASIPVLTDETAREELIPVMESEVAAEASIPWTTTGIGSEVSQGKTREVPENYIPLSEGPLEADHASLPDLQYKKNQDHIRYLGTPEVVDMDSFNVRAPDFQGGGALQIRLRGQNSQHEQEFPNQSPVSMQRKKTKKSNEDIRQKEFMSDTEVTYDKQASKQNISFEDILHSDTEAFSMELSPRDPGKTLQEAAMESITANLAKQPHQKPHKPWWQESEQPINYTRGVYRPQNIQFRPRVGDGGSGRYDDSLIHGRTGSIWSDRSGNYPTESEGEADTEEYTQETNVDVSSIHEQMQQQPHYCKQQQQQQQRFSQVSIQSNDSVFVQPHMSPTHSAHSSVSSSKRVTIVEGKKVKKKRKRDKPPSIMEPGPVDFSQYPVTARLWMEQVDKKTVQKSKTMSLMVMPDGMQPPEELRHKMPHYESTSADVFPPQWVIARGRTLRKKSKRCSSSTSLTRNTSGPDSDGEGQPERPMSPGRQVLLFFRVGSNWRDLTWILFDGIYSETETLKLIKDIQLKHPGDLSQQVRDMMHRWWKKKKAAATVEELQRALDIVNLGYIKEDFDQRHSLTSFTDTEDDLNISEVSDTDPDVNRLIGEYQIHSLNASFDCENASNPQYSLPPDQMMASLSEKGMLHAGYSHASLGHHSSSSGHPTYNSSHDSLLDDAERKFLIVTPQLKHADYRHETTI